MSFITQEFISEFNFKRMLGEPTQNTPQALTKILEQRGIKLRGNYLYSGRPAGATFKALLLWHKTQRNSLQHINLDLLPRFNRNSPITNEDIFTQLTAMSIALSYITKVSEGSTASFVKMGASQRTLALEQQVALDGIKDTLDALPMLF
jgi:hypothetical protein